MGARKQVERREPSWSFWRGFGAILVLSVAGFVALTSGSYKNNTTAPAVAPGWAAAFTLSAAAVSILVLWRREGRR